MRGNRLYSSEQLGRLLIIKRLIDSGLRPSQVVAASGSALDAMLEDARRPSMADVKRIDPLPVIAWMKQRDPEYLRQCLQSGLNRVGLRSFVIEVMPRMNQLVGEAWANGEIGVRDEHVYTETIHQMVTAELASIRNTEGSPRVLITTPVGELHRLGILMVNAVLALQGAYCLSLGAQTPVEEIVNASHDYGIEIVCLSFSIKFRGRKIVHLLRELRRKLPEKKQLWAGGAGAALLETVPRGVVIFSRFPESTDVDLARIKK